MFKVVRGNPTPEELAAALTVVQARAAVGAVSEETEETTEWSDPARTVPGRRLPHPGPKAWRTTYWPA